MGEPLRRVKSSEVMIKSKKIQTRKSVLQVAPKRKETESQRKTKSVNTPRGLAQSRSEMFGGSSDANLRPPQRVFSETNLAQSFCAEKQSLVQTIYNKIATTRALSHNQQVPAIDPPLIENARMLTNFHGYLPNEDIDALLTDDGDFVFTLAGVGQQTRLSLALRRANAIYRLAVREAEGYQICVQGCMRPFASLEKVIEFGRSDGFSLPELGHQVVRLKRAVEQQGWEIEHNLVELGSFLGGGVHGQVFSGSLKTGKESVPVAIKMSHKIDGSDVMMHECRLMRQYKHPHIVRFYGVALKRQPLLMVMELAVGGTLLRHLRKFRHKITGIERSEFGIQVSKGMEYLNSRQCIHRDLAARNCLLGERNMVKLSDFGLSVEGGFYRLEKATDMPIRWSAPETLKETVYTDKTDVWSFGVLLWEIWSDGADPYPGMKKLETKNAVLNGYRMNTPDRMPPVLEVVMRKCWQTSPELRPPFVRIVYELTEAHKSISHN